MLQRFRVLARTAREEVAILIAAASSASNGSSARGDRACSGEGYKELLVGRRHSRVVVQLIGGARRAIGRRYTAQVASRVESKQYALVLCRAEGCVAGLLVLG